MLQFLKDWHRRYLLGKAIRRIRRDPAQALRPEKRLLADLAAGWGNTGFVASEEFLAGALREALSGTGPILECGSGASTILLGLAAERQGRTVWTLEHDADWGQRVTRVLVQQGIRSVQVIHAPLSARESFDWYTPPAGSLPEQFNLVICDGPPGTTSGGRRGLVPVMGGRFAPGCVILLDDLVRPGERSIAAEWAVELDAKFSVSGTSRPFARLECPPPAPAIPPPATSTAPETAGVEPREPVPKPAQASRAVDRALLHGIAWTGGMRWATQVLSWASMLVVARLLTPGDFGLVGAASVYLGLVNLVSELGLGAAIVQRRDLTEEQVAQLGGVSILFGVALSILSCILAIPVGLFFRQDAVTPIIAAMSVTFVTSGAQVVPRSLLQRELGFRRLAAADGIQALVATVATITLAASGFRYWSLVLSNLIAAATMTVLFSRWRPHRFAWPRDLAGLRGAISFGWQVVVSRVAWYGYSNADFTVVGRALGPAALGHYTLGWTIASIPVDRIAGLVGRVLPGIFSTIQQDIPEIRRYVLLLTEGLALITFPLSIGLFLVGDDLVRLALGNQWTAAALPLRLLCFYAGFRSICTIFSHLLVNLGHARLNMYFSLFALAVLPPLFLFGSRWGTAGVAAAWIVGYPLVMVPVFTKVFQLIDLSVAEYLRSLRLPVLGTLLMSLVVVTLKQVDGALPLTGRLAAEVAAGALTYLVVAVAPQRQRVRSVLATFRRQAR